MEIEVNVMTLAFVSKLDLKVWHTNIGAQNINGSTFKIFEIAFVGFKIENKLDKLWFF